MGCTALKVGSGASFVLERTFSTFSAKKRLNALTSMVELAGTCPLPNSSSTNLHSFHGSDWSDSNLQRQNLELFWWQSWRYACRYDVVSYFVSWWLWCEGDHKVASLTPGHRLPCNNSGKFTVFTPLCLCRQALYNLPIWYCPKCGGALQLERWPSNWIQAAYLLLCLCGLFICQDRVA